MLCVLFKYKCLAYNICSLESLLILNYWTNKSHKLSDNHSDFITIFNVLG